MDYMLSLEIAGGVVTYLFGIFGLSYLHGYRNPDENSMDEIEIAAVIFWPVCLGLALPLALIAGIIFGIVYPASKLRNKAVKAKTVVLQERRRQENIVNEINNIEMFEDRVNS
jgi:large-conductance mechanosensitive channel